MRIKRIDLSPALASAVDRFGTRTLVTGGIGLAIAFIAFVWTGKKIVEIWQIRAQEKLLSPAPQPIKKARSKTMTGPSIVDAAEALSLDLGRISEIAPLSISPVGPAGPTFASEAVLVSVPKKGRVRPVNISVITWKVVVDEPISMDLVLMPLIQSAVVRHHGEIVSVSYQHEGGKGSRGPVFIVTLRIYGEPPTPRSQAEQGVLHAHSLDNYLRGLSR